MTVECSSVAFGSTIIRYTVRRTARRKTVSIAVDDEGVVLAAPHDVSLARLDDVSLARLDDVVRAKARWIVGAVRAVSDRPPPPRAREFVSGETFLYAGRQHTLRVVAVDASNEPRARLDHGRLVVRTPTREPEHVRAVLEGWYRRRADERLREVVDAWATRTGLRPARVSIVAQRRRWGSCSPSGELRLNWRIVGASKRLVEYVVAHELVHLEHPDHTPAFWRALGRVMADYEVRRDQLREVGPLLTW